MSYLVLSLDIVSWLDLRLLLIRSWSARLLVSWVLLGLQFDTVLCLFARYMSSITHCREWEQTRDQLRLLTGDLLWHSDTIFPEYFSSNDKQIVPLTDFSLQVLSETYLAYVIEVKIYQSARCDKRIMRECLESILGIKLQLWMMALSVLWLLRTTWSMDCWETRRGRW